jgi:hypothetical protein
VSLFVVLVAKSFDAVVVWEALACSADCSPHPLDALTEDPCWAPIEALWSKLLVVVVEAPKLEPSDEFFCQPLLVVRAALLLRFAEALRAPDELEDELPWFAWLELPLLAIPVPVVFVVAWLFPVLLALFEPVLDGLL